MSDVKISYRVWVGVIRKRLLRNPAGVLSFDVSGNVPIKFSSNLRFAKLLGWAIAFLM